MTRADRTALRPDPRIRTDGGSALRQVDPADVDPAGATITVAFTGALIAALGVGLSFFVDDAAFVFVILGIVVIVASPVAYVRVRSLQD